MIARGEWSKRACRQDGCAILCRSKGPWAAYGFLGFSARVPGAPEAPKGSPKAIRGPSGELPEAPGAQHKPKQKTQKPKSID